MLYTHLFLLVTFFSLEVSLALDNGLARTPPMGWLTWERFRCNIDCENDPENCLSERLIKQQAILMKEKGFLDAGYEYIIIDDCWPSHQRDNETGKLISDPVRFPSGLKALGDFVHDLGLKYGIYEDYGTHTCGGYPGVIDHMQLDAQTLAEWGADYIKLDGCYSDVTTMDKGYPEFGKYLNQTGRPIVYSCSWPAYQSDPDYPAIAKSCNLWRNWGDISDSWESVKSIINWFADNQETFAHLAGPGNWNDPDMVIGGNFGLSYDQAKVQMAIWSIMASPLIMSNDLRNLSDEFMELLLNKHVIAINQDVHGIQGRRVYQSKDKKTNIFVRKIGPVEDNYMSAAVAITNFNDGGSGEFVSFTPQTLGLTNPKGYVVIDAFDGVLLAQVNSTDQVKVRVNPTGVQLLRMNVRDKTEFDAGYIKNTHSIGIIVENIDSIGYLDVLSDYPQGNKKTNKITEKEEASTIQYDTVKVEVIN